MASRMFASKTSRSQTKDKEAEKLSVASRRISSIPGPSSSKSSIPTTSSRSMTRKTTPTKSATSSSKTESSSKAQLPKAAERRFPLYTGPDDQKQDMGVSTHISADPMPQKHRLRRKPSLSDQRSVYAQSAQSVASHEYHAGSEASKDFHIDPYSGAVLGVSLPPSTITSATVPLTVSPELATSQSRMQSFIKHGRQPPQTVSTPELKPPAPGFIRSHSASTGASESPSPFSNFSRGSTPTSMSSASPAVSQIPKFSTRRASSPTRTHPPITRNKLNESTKETGSVSHVALSSVRESSNPASAASSIKSPEPPIDKSTTKKKVLRKSPPNPPQRVSSKSAMANSSIDETISKKEQKPSLKLSTKSSHVATTASETPISRKPSTKTNLPTSPPPRPSRDGAPSLGSFGRSPMSRSATSQSQSDAPKIPRASSEVDERPSEDKQLETESRNVRSTSTALQSKLQNTSQASSTRPSVTSPHLISREASRSREPSTMRNPISSRQSSREPSPSVTSPSKTFSRFGLFAKRLKSPSETSVVQQVEKHTRKGPAAGTGHEGYGRYGRRGRSSSTSTAASRARSTSTESNSFAVPKIPSSRKSSFNSSDGRPELDDFLKDRLEPVVIGGGGQIKENRNSSAAGSIAADSQYSNRSADSLDQPRSLYRQDAKINSSATSMAESFESIGTGSAQSGLSSTVRPTLAHRRSLLRAQLSGEASGIKLPKPINTKRIAASPGPETYDSTLSTAPPTDASGPLTDVSEGHEGNWLRSGKSSSSKPKKTRKWNIFHRRQRSKDSVQGPALSRQSSNEQHALGISGFEASQPVAHYALLDDFDSDHPENMEEALRNIENNLEGDDFASDAEIMQPREPSMLLPSPPKFPSQFETFTTIGGELNTPPVLTNVAINRQPRLQQIGRIPRVVSKRERLHKPSPQSFSRPFARQTDTEDTGETSLLSQFPAAGGRPKLGLRTGALSGNPLASPFEKSNSAPLTNGMLYNLDGEQEFLHFSPRKWSEVSTANSSGTMSLAAITAMISPPDAVLSDDEVWGEFDDFLDHVTSPVSASPCTPGLKATSDYFTMSMIGRDTKTNLQTSPSNSVTTIDSSGSADNENDRTTAPLKTNLLLPPHNLHQLESPVSLTDLYANYGARSSTAKSTLRDSTLSTISGSQYSSQTPISRSASRSSVTSGQTKRVTQVMAEKTRCNSPDSLRFSALMTSRWLSFDRVLFSPIQGKMRSTRQDRILVVDGLGNDDWSTYCALTFPTAAVHSLSSMSSRANREQRNPENWNPPSNHRRHTYTDVNAPFPFVKNWFSAVVFRFPAANTSMAYRHAISECERVLRPGGYLELSILDMDMVNMGSKTSQAVRSLKMHMHEARPEISLSPVSDEILKLLGRKGFENVSRAIVGVPVVGSDTGSPIKSHGAQSPYSTEDTRASLGEMLADQAKSQDLHYPSTKAMAKAARWWWSKCYESLSRDMYSSIWENEALLRECENRETGLKLFVCYAQKQLSPPRRTMSV